MGKWTSSGCQVAVDDQFLPVIKVSFGCQRETPGWIRTRIGGWRVAFRWKGLELREACVGFMPVTWCWGLSWVALSYVSIVCPEIHHKVEGWPKASVLSQLSEVLGSGEPTDLDPSVWGAFLLIPSLNFLFVSSKPLLLVQHLLSKWITPFPYWHCYLGGIYSLWSSAPLALSLFRL